MLYIKKKLLLGVSFYVLICVDLHEILAYILKLHTYLENDLTGYLQCVKLQLKIKHRGFEVRALYSAGWLAFVLQLFKLVARQRRHSRERS